MTVYAVGGNVREQLGTEQAAEVASIDTASLATVIANMDAIKRVADSLGSFANLDIVVATAQAAAGAAQIARAGSEAAENTAQVAASGIDAKVQLADDWARKTDAPVSGTDISSKQSALNAASSAADATGAADAAAFSAAAAGGSAATTDQFVNGPSGQEVTPGHFTMSTYVDQIMGIVAQAPVLAGRFINNAGIAGTETINFAATDFYHTIEVQRAVGHDVKLKCLQGIYTGPVPAGLDRSYAWVQVVNSGLGNVTIEGPQPPGGGTTTTVFPPKRTAFFEADYKDNTPGAATPTVKALVPISVPAGTGRIVTIVTISSWWSGTGHTAVVTGANVTGVTKQSTTGDGTIGNANPLLCEIWTGTLPDGAGGTPGPAVTDLGISVTLSPFYARAVVIVAVHQDCSGFENIFAAQRSGTTTTIAHTSTPTVAQSANFIAAAFRGNTTNPVNVTALPVTTDAEDFNTNGVCQPNTTMNDPAWSVMNDGGLLAVGYAYTATAAVGQPAVMAGITLKPRTVTVTTPGDDGLITDQTKPFTIAPKQQGFVLAASDGTTWYADK